MDRGGSESFRAGAVGPGGLLTVAEVAANLLPPGARLLGGQGGLSRPVTWAAALRPRPPAFGGLKGGELALVSMRSLRQLDDTLTLSYVLDRLARLDVAAVIVRDAGAAPLAEAATIADERRIPLFLIPDEASLSEIERNVTRLIADRRTAAYERSQRIHRELMDIALRGEGLRSILDHLASDTGCTITLEDRAHELWVAAGKRKWESLAAPITAAGAELDGWIRGQRPSAADPPTMRQTLGEDLQRWVAPVIDAGEVAGFLSIVGGIVEIGEAGRLLVAAAAAACAIDLARQRALHAAEDRAQSDVVEDLLTRNYPDEAAIAARCRRIGLDLTVPVAVLVLASDERAPGARLAGAVARITDRRLETLPWRYRDGTVALLLPTADDRTPPARRAREIVAETEAELGSPVTAGLGEAYPGSEGVRRAYHEAMQALDLGRRLHGPGSLTAYADLGLYRLLLDLHGSPNLRQFHDEQLGALEDYDRRNGANLVETLDVYFRSNNSPTEAAARLHLHRNTMIYRLQRIRDIAGVDLDDPEARLKLHLALRIREVLAIDPAA